MMKRICSCLLALLLFLPVLPASAEEYHLTADRILAMAEHMAEMATGDYLTIKGVPEDLQQTAREWAQGISGTPRLIVHADVDNSSLMLGVRSQFLTQPDIVRMEAESTAVIEIVNYLEYGAASEGDVKAASFDRIAEVNYLVHAEMRFAQPGAEEGCDLYFVLYEDATPLLIMSNYENGTSAVTGWFLPSRRLANCKNVGQVSMWLMLNGFTMTCKEVPLP